MIDPIQMKLAFDKRMREAVLSGELTVEETIKFSRIIFPLTMKDMVKNTSIRELGNKEDKE